MRGCLLAVMLVLCSLNAYAGNVLVVGDSISAAYGIDKSQGWVALLGKRLAGECPGIDVKNASVSGETTAGGLMRLPALLERHDPEVVVIELGGNDGLRGLSVQALESNLAQMIALSREHGARVVLLGMRMPANYGAAYRELFDRAFRRVADASGVPFTPLFLEGVHDRDAWMQEDGVHPTAAAQPRLLENAWALLGPVLADRCAPAGD